ncbi:hypothetical protein EMCRGX_G018308, partial [Ephydatia muelleri]
NSRSLMLLKVFCTSAHVQEVCKKYARGGVQEVWMHMYLWLTSNVHACNNYRMMCVNGSESNMHWMSSHVSPLTRGYEHLITLHSHAVTSVPLREGMNTS